MDRLRPSGDPGRWIGVREEVRSGCTSRLQGLEGCGLAPRGGAEVERGAGVRRGAAVLAPPGRVRLQRAGRGGSLPRMTDSSTQSIVIEAPPSRVVEVICDFPRYPEWVSAMVSTEVVEAGPQGRAAQVRFVLDAGVFTDEYTLRYEYAADLGRISWHLVAPSRVQKQLTGSYEIAAGPHGTSTVTYTLSVELAISMLGMLRRKAEKKIMDTALRELKRRVEAVADV